MDRKAAKELLHIDGWLDRSAEIVARGKDAYLADDLLKEAGDSLMMKLGEAANRLSRLDVLAPDGVEWALAVANRNFIIHQYDQINRELTWLTLSVDLVVLVDDEVPVGDGQCPFDAVGGEHVEPRQPVRGLAELHHQRGRHPCHARQSQRTDRA